MKSASRRSMTPPTYSLTRISSRVRRSSACPTKSWAISGCNAWCRASRRRRAACARPGPRSASTMRKSIARSALPLMRLRGCAAPKSYEGNAMKRLIVAATALFLGFTPAKAADISRIVVGFPAGQATDIVARLIAERIGPILGETFIVENRPGQGGSIALAQLAKTQADGKTLVLAPLASLVANPHLYKSVGYDTLKDFAPVTLVCDLPILFVVNPSLPVKNVAELIAYAKANPDKINYSSSGNGTLSHLGMEDFKRRAGISLMHVPYRGSPPAMTDLVAGVVSVGMDTVTVTQPFVQAGSLRAIASAYSQRIPSLPDVPTLAEQGFPGFGIAAWIGFVAPAGTPKERIDAINAAVSKVVQSEEIAEKFTTLGTISRLMGPADFAEFIKSENTRWSEVVKASGAKVD